MPINNRIILIITLSIILLAALFFAFFKLIPEKKVEQTGTKSVVVESEQEKKRKLIDISNLAYAESVKKNSHEECLKIEEAESRDNCLTAFALKASRPGVCEYVKNETKQIDCRDRTAYRSALNEKNIAKCLDFNDDYKKKSCIIKLSNELKYAQDDCLKLGAEAQEACVENLIFKKVMEEKNIKYCDELARESIKAECRSIIY